MLTKPENTLKLSIFTIGFTTLIAQIIFLREFISVYNGNELIVGTILANWMFTNAIGAYLGKYIKKIENQKNLIVYAHILLGVLPLLLVYLIYYSLEFFFFPGQLVNMVEVFIISFIILSPFCIISGILFTIISAYYSSVIKKNVINKVYGIEAFGALIGGVIFNFLLIFVLKTYYSLIVLFILNFTVAGIHFFVTDKKIGTYITAFLTIAVSGFLILNDFDENALKHQFQNQEILYHKDTPYGKIAVTKFADQINFYDNGVFQFSDDNIITSEEGVHYGMIQHPAPKHVLLISGGASGMIQEILKYDIESLDYVEQNPALIDMGKLYTDNIIGDERISIIYKDPRIFLKKKSEKKYDVILINLPDPYSTQINRFYTSEFFEQLRKSLDPYGIITISLLSKANYISEEARNIHSSIFSTLKLIFQNVIIIPGEKNYFIASNVNLSHSITELIDIRQINTEYVNNNYLDDETIKKESNLLKVDISTDIDINEDFNPVVYLFQLRYWLSYFNLNYYLLGLLIILPVFIIILRLNYINLGLFVTGFSASSIEIVLIIAFQVIYGYTYQMMGIIITFFMLGLWFGSIYLIEKVRIKINTYSIIQYLIGIFAVLLTVVLFALKTSYTGYIIVHGIFIILISVIGLLTGLQFSLASKLRDQSVQITASSSYSSDLLGSAVGAVIVSSILIPLFGLIKVSLILGIINFIIGLLILVKAKKHS
ncbi:MAG: fused MFS/spermidine synthase [Bacteroidales bacterium]|nr:fused MFS/spermidine synthase [Bacteroidales bacterium]